jgi:hypothetical protein
MPRRRKKTKLGIWVGAAALLVLYRRIRRLRGLAAPAGQCFVDRIVAD